MAEQKSPMKRGYYKKNRTSVVPVPNPEGYGARWQWDDKKYQLAEYIAQGYTYKHAGELVGISSATVTRWLKIPEFCAYIDNLIYETGVALKGVRISKMKRMADQMEAVFYRKASELMSDPSEEKLKDISFEFRELLKQIAVEKEEWVELNRTEHNIKGDLNLNTKASIEKVEKYIHSLEDTDREALKKEFEAIADEVIANLTN